MDIAFFGSSLVSAYWNGAATYYRGLIRALHERGHRITFYEPDAYERQQNRDMPDPDWARVVVYRADSAASVLKTLQNARGADLVVKASGVGVFDELLEEAVLELRSGATMVAFWDVDAPATLDRTQMNPSDPFRRLIPEYDLIFTYGGGIPVISAYSALGARGCVPIYNGVDARSHFPVAPDSRFEAALAFLGNRLPDRERRVDEFFLGVASRMPEHRFLLGGSGWGSKLLPPNVNYISHVFTRDHNAFNSTPAAVLNITRESMVRYGFSPATRVFEAAGAGACLITDAWDGIEEFFEPGREVLVVHSGSELEDCLRQLRKAEARRLGAAALRRVLAQHTYDHRAAQVEKALHTRSSRATESKTHGLRLVILGLSITSSWGNGHATTYRGLVRGLGELGHSVLFLERDVPWYAAHRDLPVEPGRIELYSGLEDLQHRYRDVIREADAVVVGSYVPDGAEIGEWVTETARGVTAFYDIDTPVTLAMLGQGRAAYLTKDLIERYHLYLSFTGGPMLNQIERHWGSPRARPLYCSAEPQTYYPDTTTQSWDLGYLGTYSIDRQPALQSLLLDPANQLKSLSFVVAGAQFPDNIPWPDNVRHIAHVPPAEHRRFYNSQRFTLNLTRAEMIAAGYSPSIRLFEAAACGTPVISDFWEGLDSFFEPGQELLIARSAEETVHILESIGPAQAREIGERARQRVLSEHTARHRALQLAQYVRELMPERRSIPGRLKPFRAGQAA